MLTLTNSFLLLGVVPSVEQTAVTVTFVAFEIYVTALRTSPSKSSDADNTAKRSLLFLSLTKSSAYQQTR